MTISILYHAGCPHARPAIDLVRRCIAQLGIAAAILEDEGDHPSPTVLVDGRDVMGVRPPPGRYCRLDVPTEDHVLDALRNADGGTR